MPGDLAFYRALLEADPRLTSARACLAQALLADGDAVAAECHAGEAIAADASLVPAWLTRAAARRALGNLEGAAEDFAQAAGRAPGRPMILNSLATCLVDLGRLAEAERALRNAIAAWPGCASAPSFGSAPGFASAPGRATALANLGSVLALQGRLAEAEAPCRAALALDPSLTSAHQNLAAILADPLEARRHRDPLEARHHRDPLEARHHRDPLEARHHRDAAYGARQVFVDAAPRPERRVLVLAAADNGNVPLQHLLPRATTTVIRWYIEYGCAADLDALPEFDAVFNGIGDADRMPKTMPAIHAALAERGWRVLNDPDAVSRTGRAALPGLLADIPGVLVPPARRCSADLAAQAAAVGYPVLLRPVGSHGGDGLCRVDHPGALPEADLPAYVTRFVDFAAPDGWYRKYRMIFVAGRPMPYHLAIARHWLVHHWTAGMADDPARLAEERRFLADPDGVLGPAAMDALHTIGQRLSLDYAGIDFSVLPDGRLVVFEANATMLVHPEPDGPFAYRNQAVAVIRAAFDRLPAGVV